MTARSSTAPGTMYFDGRVVREQVLVRHPHKHRDLFFRWTIRNRSLGGLIGMAPRTWTVTVEGRTVEVVAGTREAAEKIAARRIAQGRL